MASRKYLIYSIGGMSALALGAGVLYFLLAREYIIIAMPYRHCAYIPTIEQTKKNNMLYGKTATGWRQEMQMMLWSMNQHTALTQLLAHFMRWYQEDIGDIKHALIESVAFGTRGDLYISFDRLPFGKQASLANKWYFLESFLATIRHAELSIVTVTFLVQQKPLIDPHVDCKEAWPIYGYLEV